MELAGVSDDPARWEKFPFWGWVRIYVFSTWLHLAKWDIFVWRPGQVRKVSLLWVTSVIADCPAMPFVLVYWQIEIPMWISWVTRSTTSVRWSDTCQVHFQGFAPSWNGCAWCVPRLHHNSQLTDLKKYPQGWKAGDLPYGPIFCSYFRWTNVHLSFQQGRPGTWVRRIKLVKLVDLMKLFKVVNRLHCRLNLVDSNVKSSCPS